MKKYFIISIFLLAIIGFTVGMIVYKLNKSRTIEIADSNFLEIIDECTKETELYELAMLKETNSVKKVISPNASITFKNYYKKCKHTIIRKEKVNEEIVNLSEEELKNKYKEYKIEKFSEDNIVMCGEIKDFCNEHYILKSEEGYIVIYTLNENEYEKLLEKTNISTKFLTQEDLKRLEKGFKIYTKQELNKILEDYEQ